MPRIRGKDASNKASTGTQLEQSEEPKTRSRAPRGQVTRQEKRRRIDRQLQRDARKNHFDSLGAHAQSVGKHPKGKP